MASGVGDAERRAHLLGGNAVHVARRQDDPLPLGQHRRAGVTRGWSSARQRAPPPPRSARRPAWAGRPRSGPGRTTARCGPREPPGSCQVGEDLEDPRTQRRPALGAVQPPDHAIQVSWTISCADASVDTYVRATRSIIDDHRSTTSANAAASPRRRRSTSSASSRAATGSAWRGSSTRSSTPTMLLRHPTSRDATHQPVRSVPRPRRWPRRR